MSIGGKVAVKTFALMSTFMVAVMPTNFDGAGVSAQRNQTELQNEIRLNRQKQDQAEYLTGLLNVRDLKHVSALSCENEQISIDNAQAIKQRLRNIHRAASDIETQAKLSKILSFIESKNITFCPVDEYVYAGSYDQDNSQFYYYNTENKKIPFDDALYMVMEQMQLESPVNAEYKLWDATSQLAYRLLSKAYAFSYAQILDELSQQDEVSNEDIQKAVFEKIQFFMHYPAFYKKFTPDELTGLYIKSLQHDYTKRDFGAHAMLWNSYSARSSLRKIDILGGENPINIADVLPNIYKFRRGLGDFAGHLEYLDTMRHNPKNFRFVVEDKYSRVQEKDLLNAFKHSAYRYNFPQALDHAARRYDKSFDYHSREANESGIAQGNCMQVDFRRHQIEEPLKYLWHNTQRIKDSNTTIGNYLYSFAKKREILLCENEVSMGSSGNWSDDSGIATIKAHDHHKYSHDYALSTIAHEISHGIQGELGLLGFNGRGNIYQWQQQALSYEAGARLVSLAMVYELQMQNYMGAPWKKYANSADGASFASAYAAHLNAGGGHYFGALQAAGAAAWPKIFTNEHWVNGINKWVVRAYARRLLDGGISAKQGRDFTLEHARQVGFVSENLNLTAQISSMPEKGRVFADNLEMRQIYEVLHLEYLNQNSERKSEYFSEYKRLLDQQNPFLFVDLKIIDLSRDDIYEQFIGLQKFDTKQTILAPAKV